MKILPKILIAVVVLAVMLQPLAVMASKALVPAEKKITTGTTIVRYAGQRLEFITPVALIVKLEPVSLTSFDMIVSLYPGAEVPSGSPAVVVINWKDFGTQIYSGPPPSPWESLVWTVDTESGFTEK